MFYLKPKVKINDMENIYKYKISQHKTHTNFIKKKYKTKIYVSSWKQLLDLERLMATFQRQW